MDVKDTRTPMKLKKANTKYEFSGGQPFFRKNHDGTNGTKK
jgi:hypothetical protein